MKGLELRDALVSDAVEAQKATGKEFCAPAAESYIVEVLRGMDRKESDRPTPVSTSKKSDAVGREFEKRSGHQLDGWQLDRKPTKLKTIDEVKATGYRRLQKRIRWIATKPDLFAELQSVTPALVAGVPETREKAAERLRALIEKSNRLYGRDWRLAEPRKLWSK